MREKREKRTKIVAVFAAVVLIVALIVGMVSCSSGKATDRTDGTGEQLEHYPVGIVTKPSGDGNEGSEPTTGSEPAEPSAGTEDGTEPADEKPEVTEPLLGSDNNGATNPVEPGKTTAPVEENPVKPTEPKPTTPKPSDPVKPTEPKPTVPTPTEPKPTTPKPTEPKPTEPAPTNPTKPVEEHKHSFRWVTTKEPTCEGYGRKSYVCSECGYEETWDNIDPLGHKMYNDVIASTCTESGYTVERCKVCGAKGNTFNFTQPLGHSYSVTAHKDKSCTTDGYDKYTCSRCGNSYTDTIPAAHNWVHHHEDAEGYDEVGIECRCGWVVWESEVPEGYDMYTYYQLFHVKQFESSKGHSYDEVMRTIITKPAKDWDECSVCGKRG